MTAVSGTRATDRPAALSALAFLAWTLIMVAALPGWRAAWLILAALAYSALAWGRLPSVGPRAWTMLAGAVVVSSLALGEPMVRWGPVSLSARGVELGALMAARALAILLTFSATIGALSPAQLSGLFERVGLRGTGFAVGLALNLLPTLRTCVMTAFQSARLRGGFRRRPVRDASLVAAAALGSALRSGDEAALAAAARGFDPSRRMDEPMRIGKPDVMVLVALAGAGAALLLV